MSYESAFVSRATAKAIARLYQAEGNDSFIYKAGDRKDPKSGVSKPWFKVELGKPGPLDAQLPQVEWYPSAGTRPARAEELPVPMPRGPSGEYLPIPRVELEKGEKAGPKYGATIPSDLCACMRSVREAEGVLHNFSYQFNDTTYAVQSGHESAETYLERSRELFDEVKEQLRQVSDRCGLTSSFRGFPIEQISDGIGRDLGEGIQSERIADGKTREGISKLDGWFEKMTLLRILDSAMVDCRS